MPCRVSGCLHAKPIGMARSAISRPHLRVLETRALLVCHRRIGKSSRSAIQGHGDSHATVHSPKVTPPVTVLRALEWQISLVVR